MDSINCKHCQTPRDPGEECGCNGDQIERMEAEIIRLTPKYKWWKERCGKCGYYIGKSRSGSFIGCRLMPGNTTRDCRACPQFVPVEKES